MNQVIEIPDTPERLVATKHNKDRNKQHMPTKISIICNGIKRSISIPTSCNKSPFLTYFRKTKPTIDNDRHDKGKALANTEVQKSTHKVNGHVQCEKGVLPLANLPAIVSLDRSGKSLKVENIPKIGPTFDCGKGVDVLADKGKALANTKVQTSTHKVNGHVQSEKGVLPLANSPAIVSLDGSGKSLKVENIPKNGPTFDSGKGVDVLAENNTQPCTSTKVYSRSKKLVRNVCVPPFNIEESKKVVVKCQNGSVMKEVTSGSGTVASDGGSSVVDIKDLVAEENDSRRHKGKGISCHFLSEEDNAGSSHLSQRERIHKDPAESSTGFDVDANGWRTTHNHWKQRDNKQHKNEIMESVHKDETDIKPIVDSAQTSSCMCHQPNENESGINTQTESSTTRNRGKRPISFIEDSVGQPTTITSKRKQRDIKQQKTETVQRNHNNGIEIIDFDDSPIASSCVRDIPDAEELGIDRQLESSTSRNRGKRPTSCIEDSVGLSWATSRSKRSKNLTRPRLKRNKNLSGPSTSNPVSEPNVQIHGNNEDLSVRALQMEEDEIFAQQLQQQLYNEELERGDMLAIAAAEGDMRMRNDLLQVDREFNENDYEMLLALDEDNYKHQGATRAQINSLPVSTVQTENSQECLICLESANTGEKIRHLPCLHKFHKACVDEWLSRRTSCPVCKTSVDVIG